MRSGSEWLSIADMMAGLMMVFMLVAVGFMLQVEEQRDAMAEVAQAYASTRSDLDAAVREEFAEDLADWGAQILPDSRFRFRRPEVLFAVNSAEVTPRFAAILDDFFPRYLAILQRPEFLSEITELRIEGHTSSIWQGAQSDSDAYLNNADLSQARSLAVLRYAYGLSTPASRQWLQGVLRANGLSSAQLVRDDAGIEDAAASRRVEFRVLTRTQERISEILRRAREP